MELGMQDVREESELSLGQYQWKLASALNTYPSLSLTYHLHSSFSLMSFILWSVLGSQQSWVESTEFPYTPYPYTSTAWPTINMQFQRDALVIIDEFIYIDTSLSPKVDS